MDRLPRHGDQPHRRLTHCAGADVRPARTSDRFGQDSSGSCPKPFHGVCAVEPAAFRDCFDDRMSRMREGDSGCGAPIRCLRLLVPRGPRVSGGRISRKPEEKADADDPSRCLRLLVPRGPRVSGGRISRKPEAKADADDPIRCLRLLEPRGPQPPGAEARNSLSLRAPSAGLRSDISEAPVPQPPSAPRPGEHVPQTAPRRPDTEIPAAAQCTSFRAAGTDFPRKLSYLCRYL